MMSRGMKRAERLREMERLYLQRAWTDMEMAERLGNTRPTVWKDRTALQDGGFPIVEEEDQPGRWRMDRTRYMSAVRLNLHEALTLYLAARRASRQTQAAAPHAANALEKLATALHQPMTQRLVKAAGNIHTQGEATEKTKIMETIARAWAERIRVRLVYRAQDGRAKTHLVNPYLIEPSQWSDAVYLIGHSDLGNAVYPFKTERIERATLTTERFDWPEDFDERRLLRHAWGIWYVDREPEMVRLQFAPGRAARRLKESIWHPLEHVYDTDDGGCIWECLVDEWQEMLPWIRGWGAAVEVLGPEGLRRELMGEVRRQAELYGWHVHRSEDVGITPSLANTFQDFFGGHE